MKPLPDLADTEKMAARGRRSVLMQARNDTLAELRDAYTALQSESIESMQPRCAEMTALLQHLIHISESWSEYTS